MYAHVFLLLHALIGFPSTTAYILSVQLTEISPGTYFTPGRIRSELNNAWNLYVRRPHSSPVFDGPMIQGHSVSPPISLPQLFIHYGPRPIHGHFRLSLLQGHEILAAVNNKILDLPLHGIHYLNSVNWTAMMTSTPGTPPYVVARGTAIGSPVVEIGNIFEYFGLNGPPLRDYTQAVWAAHGDITHRYGIFERFPVDYTFSYQNFDVHIRVFAHDPHAPPSFQHNLIVSGARHALMKLITRLSDETTRKRRGNVRLNALTFPIIQQRADAANPGATGFLTIAEGMITAHVRDMALDVGSDLNGTEKIVVPIEGVSTTDQSHTPY